MCLEYFLHNCFNNVPLSFQCNIIGFYHYLCSDTRVHYKSELKYKDKPLPLGAVSRKVCTSLMNACVSPWVAVRKNFIMAQVAQKQTEAVEKDYAALIAQLPAEMQEKLKQPNPTSLQNFLETVSSIESLRYNFIKLLVEHQRTNTLDWEEEEFEDFYSLLYFLETQQYSR